METCYICLDSDVKSEIIAPCSCSTYVHRSCLEKWRLTSTSEEALTHCPTCRSRYRLEGASSIIVWVLGHSRLHVAIAAVAVISLMGFTAYWLDVHMINSFVAKTFLGHSTKNCVFYVILGIALLLALLVIILFHASQAFINAEVSRDACLSKSVRGVLQNILLVPVVMSALGVLLLYLVLSGEVDLFASVKAKLLKQYPPRVRNLRPKTHS
ncbi:hypothetical protein THRCLA_09090 [Thraustotheca clavata]|uniref:Uncharacterized protein n=1 Tax=Thraustotheca clavata TaxID=74557 RepID=A0A1V9YZA9_9STRA|nr:hypothetical protein THRCLA_09090 [Thraustotheca clavata]